MNKEFDNKSITVIANRDNYDQIMNFISDRMDELECPMQISMKVSVAADEVVANVVDYAYGEGSGELTVGVDKAEDGNGIVITFKDKGVPFNPLDREDPDVTLTAEQRSIGGLGIYMVKKMMDKVEYEYNEGNVLSLTKYF